MLRIALTLQTHSAALDRLWSAYTIGQATKAVRYFDWTASAAYDDFEEGCLLRLRPMSMCFIERV